MRSRLHRIDAEAHRQRALRVEVNEEYASAVLRERGTQVDGRRRLAHAALLVAHRDDLRGTVVGQRARDREVRQRAPGRADSLTALPGGVGRERGRVLGIRLVLRVGVVEVPFGQFVVDGEVVVGRATSVAGHGVHVMAIHARVCCPDHLRTRALSGCEGTHSNGADSLEPRGTLVPYRRSWLTTPGRKCRLIHKSSYLLGDQETSRQVGVTPSRRLATLWRVGHPQQHNPPDPAGCVGNETSLCQGRTPVARQVSPVCESTKGLRSRRVGREPQSDHTHIRPDLVGQGPAWCALLTTCVDVSPFTEW